MNCKNNKLEQKQKQEILCKVVNIFMENGIKDNDEIVKICSNLDSDKLRGVKRSITVKKQKLKKASKGAMKHFKKQETKFNEEKLDAEVPTNKGPINVVYGALTPAMRQYINLIQLAQQALKQ